MQSVLSGYHNYYDNISKDNESIQDEAQHKGKITIVANVKKHGEVKIRRRSKVVHLPSETFKHFNPDPEVTPPPYLFSYRLALT